MSPCPCGTGKSFDECCAPYLAGTSHAPTAETLMRSRYTAYTRNDMKYLARTWDTTTRPASLHEEAGLEWLSLTILHTHAGQPEDKEGSVEFDACYRAGDSKGNLHEISRFRKIGGEWFYLDGEVSDQAPPQPNQKTGRNDTCPCGSGKKFNKCCGV